MGYANPQSLRVEPRPWRAVYPGIGGFGADAAVDSASGTGCRVYRQVGGAVDGRGDPAAARRGLTPGKWTRRGLSMLLGSV